MQNRQAFSEADTRAKLIDPAIHKRGWTEDLVRREETAGSIDIIGKKAQRHSRGRTDYTLRVMVNPNTQPVAVALIEAKREDLPPTHGMEQGKADAAVTADNLKYFGEPVYEYDMAQAIEDGYLAACEIVKGRVNLDDTGIRLEEIIARNPHDAITGRPITAEELRERYEKTDYEDQICCRIGSLSYAATCSRIYSKPEGRGRRPLSSAPAPASSPVAERMTWRRRRSFRRRRWFAPAG